MAARADDGVVVAGYTDGTMPGASNAGASDVFVAAFDRGGKRSWLRQFGGAGSDRATGVAVDTAGDAYVTGYTNGSMPDTGGSHGAADAFLVKLSPEGGLLWSRQFGSPAADFARGVAVDPTGNVFVVGDTSGALPENAAARGRSDAFVAKFDASGDLDWMREFGSSALDRATGVAVDAGGDALIVGTTSGALPTNSAGGASDVFVAKVGPNGQRLWIRQFGSEGGNQADFGQAIAARPDGTSFVTGYTYGSLPGNNSSGGIDGYVARLDASGNLSWVRQFGAGRAVFGDAIALDPGGDIVTGGWSDVDPFGAKGSSGPWRVFVAKLDPEGRKPVWVRRFGASGKEEAVGLAVGRDGGVTAASSGILKRPPAPSFPVSANDVLLLRYPP